MHTEEELRQLIKDWIKSLTAYQKLIVSLTFGLNSLGMTLTASEICRLFGWQPHHNGRVKKYLNKALGKLSYPEYEPLRETFNEFDNE